MINRLFILKTVAKITKNPVFSYYDLFRKNHNLTSKELEDLQSTKIKNLISYALQNIPFYNNRFANYNFDNITELPILSKQELKDAGIDEITPKRKLIKKTTSGTTGPAFSFYVDKYFFALELARNLRILDFAGIELGEPWVLLVPLRDKKNRIFSYLSNRLVLDASLLSLGRTPLCCPKTKEELFKPDEQTIHKFFTKIIKHQPKLIYSYPSTLIALATYIKNWNIKGVYSEMIITSGEVLTQPARNFIQEIFQTEVFDLYGTTEFPAIAEECKEHNGLHIFTDSYCTEFLNNNEIIVTDLDNYTMPFIRYQTSDFGYLKSEKCRCKSAFPLMEIKQGRVSDLIVAPNGQFLRANFFSTLLQKNKEIKKYQIVQEAQDKLKLFLVSDKLLPQRKDYLYNRFQQYAGNAIKIEIEIVQDINLPLQQYLQTYPAQINS
jgi:phenylacetate-CoA ligase